MLGFFAKHSSLDSVSLKIVNRHALSYVLVQVTAYLAVTVQVNIASCDVNTLVCMCGWQEGLLEFYRNGSERRNGSTTAWPSLSTLCGCAFGAISVITLGALLANRWTRHTSRPHQLFQSQQLPDTVDIICISVLYSAPVRLSVCLSVLVMNWQRYVYIHVYMLPMCASHSPWSPWNSQLVLKRREISRFVLEILIILQNLKKTLTR